MNQLVIIESLSNFFDCGIVVETVKNAMRAKMAMGLGDFLRHLFWGKGYVELDPHQLSDYMASDQNFLIVDIREAQRYRSNHIKGAVSHSFDDFLKSILMDREYATHKAKRLVLVCDTGFKSRVAASILAEEGFLQVASLNRGMRRWNRWQNLLRIRRRLRRKRLGCCKP